MLLLFVVVVVVVKPRACKRQFTMLALVLLAGRYLFLNAIANQLRYPNSHTHYFSCVLLYLFAEANTEAIQEQITRYGIQF